ncbi:hypothetical protein DFS34DRAFT_649112 [Phlyctochytrium arcticum]|nr:hypothetical protein DFS34DRAFT_649112 [Phlyctochytrium arcticum]
MCEACGLYLHATRPFLLATFSLKVNACAAANFYHYYGFPQRSGLDIRGLPRLQHYAPRDWLLSTATQPPAGFATIVVPHYEQALHAPWVPSGKQLIQLLSQGSVAANSPTVDLCGAVLARSEDYFFILAYPKLSWVAQRIGWEQLSVFLPATNYLDYMLPNGATVYAQLLILQQPIGGQHGGIVISARSIEALSRDNIVALLNAASERLDWSTGVSGIVTSNKIRMTSPIQWSSLKTFLKNHHMFRPDASLNTWVASYFLAPLVRTMPPYGMQVDAERRRVALQQQGDRGELQAAVAMADVVVLYIRASSLVRTEISGTPGGLERQLVSMISDLNSLNPKKS